MSQLARAQDEVCHLNFRSKSKRFADVSPPTPRILIIGATPPPYNGMSLATELVAKAIGHSGEHVHLDTADRRGLANIGRFDLQNLWLAGVHALRYLWLLASKRPKLVYLPISQAWLPFLRDCMFLLPAKLTGRRVIVHLHGGYFGVFFKRTSSLMRSIIRLSLKDVDCAIVLGKRVEQAFAGILPDERVVIVPNGIPDPFAGSVVEESREEPPTILFLSTLMACKGTLDLLRSLQLVTARYGATRSVFAGEWYSKEESKVADQLVNALPEHSKPEFVGAVGPSRKCQLLERSAIFVLPTSYSFEGHPYVILEAMAAGLPIISTKWACIPEIVEDGVNGFLIEPENVQQLADRILLLLEDQNLRRRMGRASRDRFLREFTFETFAARLRGVFTAVLDGGSASRQRASVA